MAKPIKYQTDLNIRISLGDIYILVVPLKSIYKRTKQ